MKWNESMRSAPTSTARRAAAAGACALVVSLMACLPGSSTAALAVVGDPGCVTDAELARTVVRSTSDGADLSAAQAAAIERDLRSRLSRMNRLNRSPGLGALSVAPARLAAGSVSIKVYVHVITTGSTVSAGNVTDTMVKNQVAALNTAHRNALSPFTFTLAATDRTKNSSWFTASQGSSAEAAMKRSLHRGGASSLNIYTLNPSGSVGWSTIPSNAKSNTVNDGVVLLHTALPGGSYVGYNTGDTGVHEVGHWLGLLHVFQGGCSTPGDYVTDTPAQAYAAYTCGIADTCTAPGDDPVSNFMGYAPDSCMYTFTTGQVTRMSDNWRAYRSA